MHIAREGKGKRKWVVQPECCQLVDTHIRHPVLTRIAGAPLAAQCDAHFGTYSWYRHHQRMLGRDLAQDKPKEEESTLVETKGMCLSGGSIFN
jgi:hypothetical protein